MTFAVVVACSGDDRDSSGEVIRYFGGKTGGGTGGSGGGDSGATCKGVECPPPPAAAAGLAESCCQTNDTCGFKIPSIGQECLPPADTDASNTDPDCPSVTWQGKTLPGCCLPDGKTCGAVESLVGTGCLDATLFGVKATVDCDGNPVTGTGGTGGGGTGGSGTGGSGTGGSGTGGSGTGGTGGGTGCITCAQVMTGGDPKKVCTGAEATKWKAVEVCACGADGGGQCSGELCYSTCGSQKATPDATCKSCMQTKCATAYGNCAPAP